MVLGEVVTCELDGEATYDRCAAICHLNGSRRPGNGHSARLSQRVRCCAADVVATRMLSSIVKQPRGPRVAISPVQGITFDQALKLARRDRAERARI
jgi:hypothetical protein